MQKKKKLLLLGGVLVLCVLVALFAWLWLENRPEGTEGEKEITVEVVLTDGTTTPFVIHTDAEFLRGALEEIDLVQGDESEYGLFIKTVNGVTADESKQEWWCLTKNGEMHMLGVDSTPIADGDKYELTLTVGY